MASKSRTKVVDPSEIYYFVPNLIGYARVVLAIAAFAIASSYPGTFLVLYTLSFVLDAADGFAARALNQCSHFGAILDMVTDRASTAGFLVLLNHIMQPVPEWFTFLCACLVFLDVASHFCRTYVTLFLQKESHKDVSDSIFPLLRLYYSNRMVMCAMCVGQEFSYLLLFAYGVYGHISDVATVLIPMIAVTGVLCALKQLVNVQQLLDGFYHLAVKDAEEYVAKKA